MLLTSQCQERQRKKHHRSYRSNESRSPISDYSDERDRNHRRPRRDSYGSRDDRHGNRRDQSRSLSPRREYREDRRRKEDEEYRRANSPRRRYKDESPRRDKSRSWDHRDHTRHRGDPRGRNNQREHERNHRRNDRDLSPRRPSTQVLGPESASRPHLSPSQPWNNSAIKSLEEQRAARLAAMSASANELYSQRSKTVAARVEEERKELEREERMRAKFGKEHANAGFFKQQSELGLSEALQRRGGKGLLKDI
nr:hypothetical protein L204_01767 [Cryptococcus depauperatus CBS 7855]